MVCSFIVCKNEHTMARSTYVKNVELDQESYHISFPHDTKKFIGLSSLFNENI